MHYCNCVSWSLIKVGSLRDSSLKVVYSEANHRHTYGKIGRRLGSVPQSIQWTNPVSPIRYYLFRTDATVLLLSYFRQLQEISDSVQPHCIFSRFLLLNIVHTGRRGDVGSQHHRSYTGFSGRAKRARWQDQYQSGSSALFKSLGKEQGRRNNRRGWWMLHSVPMRLQAWLYNPLVRVELNLKYAFDLPWYCSAHVFCEVSRDNRLSNLS